MGINNKIRKKILLIFVHGHCTLSQLNWKIKIRLNLRDFLPEGLVTEMAVKSLLLKWDWQWLPRCYASPFIQLLADLTKKGVEIQNNEIELHKSARGESYCRTCSRLWILLFLLVAASSSNAMIFILRKMVSDALFLGRDGNVFCGKLGRTTFCKKL